MSAQTEKAGTRKQYRVPVSFLDHLYFRSVFEGESNILIGVNRHVTEEVQPHRFAERMNSAFD